MDSLIDCLLVVVVLSFKSSLEFLLKKNGSGSAELRIPLVLWLPTHGQVFKSVHYQSEVFSVISTTICVSSPQP